MVFEGFYKFQCCDIKSHLEAFWGALGRLWGRFWGGLGALLGRLGWLLGRLEASLGALGGILEHAWSETCSVEVCNPPPSPPPKTRKFEVQGEDNRRGGADQAYPTPGDPLKGSADPLHLAGCWALAARAFCNRFRRMLPDCDILVVCWWMLDDG